MSPQRVRCQPQSGLARQHFTSVQASNTGGEAQTQCAALVQRARTKRSTLSGDERDVWMTIAKTVSIESMCE